MRTWRSALQLLALDQLDLVAVRVFDKGDHRGAELDRPGRPRDLATGLGHLLAHARDVRHANSQMAESGAELVGFVAPIVGEFDDGMVLLIAVADERQGVLAFRDLALAQELHAHGAGVEGDRPVEVVHADHRVQHAIVGGGVGHSLLLYLSRIIAAKVDSAATLPSPMALPENFQTLPRLWTFSTRNSRRSPGTTGRRKRTPSIDMK